MEMVQTKVITPILKVLSTAALALSVPVASLLFPSCCSHSPEFVWEKFQMDGHRTGVVPSTAEDVNETMGKVENGVYKSPSGAVFKSGCTPLVAADMLAVQPQMSRLKEVVAYAPQALERKGVETALGNFLVDHLMEEVSRETGKKVDIGIINNGGIRVDIPKGNVLLDDIESMLPFKNYPCYVRLSGKEVLDIFNFMARTRMQVIGGASVEVENRTLKSLLIGGKPVELSRDYGVATLDFLLDGGDSLFIARNAKELIISEKKFVDVILPCVRALSAEGKPLEYQTDGRIRIIGDKRKPR